MQDEGDEMNASEAAKKTLEGIDAVRLQRYHSILGYILNAADKGNFSTVLDPQYVRQGERTMLIADGYILDEGTFGNYYGLKISWEPATFDQETV